jgi:transitional endoplasmic reticulum ATPase
MSVTLPAWADELRSRYLAGETSMFLLHGNVRDLHEWRDEAGNSTWLDLRAFLEKFLERTRDMVAYYNVSQGLEFSQKNHGKLFRSIVDGRRSLRGEEKLTDLPVTAAATIPVIEEVITDPAHSSAVIIDFFEMIAPNADVSFMVHEDKANMVALQRWSSDPAFSATDNLVILVTEHLSDISRRISSSPSLASIQVPFPEVADRERFITAQDLSKVKMDIPVGVLAKMTAGLTLVQIRNILRSAALTGDPIDFADISQRKK